MSDTLHPTRWRSIRTTPLRDLFRGRVTARLDWPARLAAAGLPADVSALVARVVRRTRLWRLERAAVADELIAHFIDAMAAGARPADAVNDFGDARAAARLIRRAKRRGRPWVWHVWAWAWRALATATAGTLVVYAAELVPFLAGRPTPTVDYIAIDAAAARAVPEANRAWPLWRAALVDLWAGKAPDLSEGNYGYDPAAAAAWVVGHPAALTAARAAAAKPALGFVVGPGGSTDDPGLFDKDFTPPTWQVDSPYRIAGLYDVASTLSLDARLAAGDRDGVRAEADVVALLGMARQVQAAPGLESGLAVGDFRRAADATARVLADHPTVWSDATLVRLAHALSGPRVAADLIDLRGARQTFADTMQRVYTDNGHGDGHLTLAGVRHLLRDLAPDKRRDDWQFFAEMPAVFGSRAQVIAAFDRLMDRVAANLALPRRSADARPVDGMANGWGQPLLALFAHQFSTSLVQYMGYQDSAERAMGVRDGVEVGLALELFHRRRGRYPDALAELTPDLLPAVPVDRITGDPVRYRLVDGKPVVYSVGADRVDDGGRPPAKPGSTWSPPAAQWDVAPTAAPRGDWVLYPPAAD